MKHELLLMPAAYAEVSAEEMCYLDGGDDEVTSDPTIFSVVGQALVAVGNYLWGFVTSTASLIADDFSNPNFQFALAFSATLVAASSLIAIERQTGRL